MRDAKKPAQCGLQVAERPERSEMNQQIKDVLEARSGFGANLDEVAAVREAAGRALEAMRGLSLAEAEHALTLTSDALRLAALVPR